MKIRSIQHAGVTILHLQGALEIGHLYGLARMSQTLLHRTDSAWIYDLRDVTNHIDALSDIVQAAEDWARCTDAAWRPAVFVSSANWALAANRIVRSVLDASSWHVADDLDEAFDILGIEGREEDVLAMLTRCEPVRLAPEVPAD